MCETEQKSIESERLEESIETCLSKADESSSLITIKRAPSELLYGINQTTSEV